MTPEDANVQWAPGAVCGPLVSLGRADHSLSLLVDLTVCGDGASALFSSAFLLRFATHVHLHT